jgi:cytochrome c
VRSQILDSNTAWLIPRRCVFREFASNWPGIFALLSRSTGHGWEWMIPIRTLLAAVTLVPAGVVAGASQAERIRAASSGELLFQQCSGCHSVDTSEKRVGPSLKGLFHKHELANGTPANERSIRRKIMNGGDGMPAYERIFSGKELDELIAYLKSR